jgi:hypothetical protein
LFPLRGNPNAPGQPSRLYLLKESTPWNRVAREWLPYYVAIAVIVLGIQIRPDLSQMSRALIFPPAVVIAAAINAFAEEFMFGSMPLARRSHRCAAERVSGLVGREEHVRNAGLCLGVLAPLSRGRYRLRLLGGVSLTVLAVAFLV